MRRMPLTWLRVAIVGCTAAFLTACGGSEQSAKDNQNKQNGAVSKPGTDNEGAVVMGVQSEPFGEPVDGREIMKYILTNKNGMSVSITNLGAIVTEVNVPDKDGKFANVVLGFDSPEGYRNNASYFGAICGRYANRIAKGKFSIDGVEYSLATNDPPNHLHGGKKGFDKVVWTATPVPADEGKTQDSVGLQLKYSSPDGDERYPGMLNAVVTYTLTNDDELKIVYSAHVEEKATPVNLTNHSYWNLAGTGGETATILDHELTLNCDKYLPVDDTLIPTGEISDVKETPMDFTKPMAIGSRLAEVKGDEPKGGYDHCYVINDGKDALRLVARVKEPKSGRVMEIFSTEPGVQFYTGNFLAGEPEHGGFEQHQGFCLECQRFPDAPNQTSFPHNGILQPGEVYTQITIHKFSAE